MHIWMRIRMRRCLHGHQFSLVQIGSVAPDSVATECVDGSPPPPLSIPNLIYPIYRGEAEASAQGYIGPQPVPVGVREQAAINGLVFAKRSWKEYGKLLTEREWRSGISSNILTNLIRLITTHPESTPLPHWSICCGFLMVAMTTYIHCSCEWHVR